MPGKCKTLSLKLIQISFFIGKGHCRPYRILFSNSCIYVCIYLCYTANNVGLAYVKNCNKCRIKLCKLAVVFLPKVLLVGEGNTLCFIDLHRVQHRPAYIFIAEFLIQTRHSGGLSLTFEPRLISKCRVPLIIII